MRYLILFVPLLLLGCSSGSSDYVLGDGTYTEAELTATWERLIEYDSEVCPTVRALDSDAEVVAYINGLGIGEDDSIQEPNPKDVSRAIALLRSICD